MLGFCLLCSGVGLEDLEDALLLPLLLFFLCVGVRMRLLVDTFGSREGLWTSFASPSTLIEEFESSYKLAPEYLGTFAGTESAGLDVTMLLFLFQDGSTLSMCCDISLSLGLSFCAAYLLWTPPFFFFKFRCCSGILRF